MPNPALQPTPTSSVNCPFLACGAASPDVLQLRGAFEYGGAASVEKWLGWRRDIPALKGLFVQMRACGLDEVLRGTGNACVLCQGVRCGHWQAEDPRVTERLCEILSEWRDGAPPAAINAASDFLPPLIQSSNRLLRERAWDALIGSLSSRTPVGKLVCGALNAPMVHSEGFERKKAVIDRVVSAMRSGTGVYFQLFDRLRIDDQQVWPEQLLSYFAEKLGADGAAKITGERESFNEFADVRHWAVCLLFKNRQELLHKPWAAPLAPFFARPRLEHEGHHTVLSA